MIYWKSVAFLFFTVVCLASQAQQKTKFSLFSLSDVKLLPGIFKEAERTNIRYVMALEPDRLLAPFLREAGLKPKAESYPNWKNTGLDGHIGGHYFARGKKYPLQDLPFFVSSHTDITPQIEPLPGKSLRFNVKNLNYPTKYQSLELMPFFRLGRFGDCPNCSVKIDEIIPLHSMFNHPTVVGKG